MKHGAAKHSSERSAVEDYLRTLQESKAASIKELDSGVLTLASGALTLSFAAVQISGGGGDRIDLVRAWAAFATAICLTVLSHCTSAGAHWRLEWRVRKAAEQGTDWRLASSVFLTRATRVLTISSALCFVGGMVLLASFAMATLGK